MEILYEYIIITMFITFMILYVSAGKKKIVYKEPTIDVLESDMYVDDSNVCYKYKRERVKCNNFLS